MSITSVVETNLPSPLILYHKFNLRLPIYPQTVHFFICLFVGCVFQYLETFPVRTGPLSFFKSLRSYFVTKVSVFSII